MDFTKAAKMIAVYAEKADRSGLDPTMWFEELVEGIGEEEMREAVKAMRQGLVYLAQNL